MAFLSDLWLPILLSAVFVFVVSSILHMALPFHKGDCKPLPGEEGVLDALRAAGVQPGEYMFPGAECMKDMGTPEMRAKFQRGPVGMMTVMPNGPINMGRSLAQWFVFSLVISVFCGYLATALLPHGAEYLAVFRLTGTVAVLAYGVSHVPDSIWKGVSWSITAKFLLDGVIYGLVTAGTFGWLWPSAAL